MLIFLRIRLDTKRRASRTGSAPAPPAAPKSSCPSAWAATTARSVNELRQVWRQFLVQANNSESNCVVGSASLVAWNETLWNEIRGFLTYILVESKFWHDMSESSLRTYPPVAGITKRLDNLEISYRSGSTHINESLMKEWYPATLSDPKFFTLPPGLLRRPARQHHPPASWFHRGI